ncbi:OmpA family protein [Cryomorphaceae bacterium 1068]|nr:OmpA family protein [Cryomorphaceae bacterium 1068]
MKIPFLMGTAILCAVLTFAAPEIQTTRIHFDSDSHLLDDIAKAQLSDFLTLVELNGDCEFQIHGHTDHEGDEEYNYKLSQKRAESVRAYLQNQGIQKGLLFTEAFGKRQLLQKSRDEKSMRENRRVDIVFKRFHFENTDELHAELAESAKNSFMIDPSVSNTLKCKRGTKVFISANGFVDSLGNPYEGDVHVKVIEALDYHDFLANELYTVSDGRLLETGGMLRITAETPSGSTLELADGTDLSIAIPSRTPLQTDMSLFVSNTGANWAETGQNFLTRSSLNIPERPAFEYADVNWPEFYFDDNTKPRYPSKPLYPTEPSKPRPQSYARKISWYQFFSRNRILKDCQRRYEIALLDYKLKLEEYAEDVDKYYQRLAQHPTWVKEYEAKLIRWQADKENSMENFKQNEWKEALRQFQYLDAAQKKKYQAKFAVWDSIRKVELERYALVLENLGFPADANPHFYIIAGTDLGWINVDRFRKLPENERFEIIATLPEVDQEEQIMAILPRSKSMVQMMHYKELSYKSLTLPRKEEILIVAYKIEEGSIKVARSLTRNVESVDLKYQPMKLSEFRKFLKGLDA